MPVLTSYVHPGDKVDVTINRTKDDGGTEKRQLRTVVFDISSDDELKLNMPMDGGKLVLLSVGTEYELCFYTENGLFQCVAVVRERYKSNNVFVVAMELTQGLRKYQRREYYRLNCVLDMKCTEIDEDDVQRFSNRVEFLETDFTMQDGIIVDISGGGIRFLSRNRYETDMSIFFSFGLVVGGRDTDFMAVGRILVSEPLENRPGEYVNRVQFVNMGADDRESIIRYIFEEERRIRRKERV